MSQPTGTSATRLPIEGQLPSLDGATEWLNSPPLTPTELRGRVVLADFWTYTCINWLRTLPYVRAWAEKYADHGLVVIGVHTPEFGIEHAVDDVRRAARDMRVDYPIAIDNDYAIWEAFDNHYWPALYIVDAQGQIRHHRFGEGDYERSEQIVQQLLTEAGRSSVPRELVSVDAHGIEAGADWPSLQSSETYVGFQRAERFASVGDLGFDEPRDYLLPDQLRLNEWALRGGWTVTGQAAVSNDANGRIVYRFHARDLHLILAPPSPTRPIPFRVRIDGEPPATSHGTDVDARGNGLVTEPRLYQLIRQPQPVTDRDFEIEFLEPGVEAFAFTFG